MLTIVIAGVKSIPATFLFEMYAVLSGVQPVLKLDREGCDVRAFRRARAADCGPGGSDWRRQKFHRELSQRYVGLRGPLSLSSAVSAAERTCYRSGGRCGESDPGVQSELCLSTIRVVSDCAKKGYGFKW